MRNKGQTMGIVLPFTPRAVRQARLDVAELRLIQDIVEAMPGRMREVVTLRKVDKCTHEQIAERLKISTREVECELEAAAIVLLALLENLRVPQPWCFLH